MPADYYGRMVIDVYMNVGPVISTGTTISKAYIAESGTITSNTAKIGLMTVSDFGYATSGITYSSVKLSSLNSYEQNNWLFGQGYEWTMTPSTSTTSSHLYCICSDATISNAHKIEIGKVVRPVLYLDSNVYIISGKGTESNPYILGM